VNTSMSSPKDSPALQVKSVELLDRPYNRGTLLRLGRTKPATRAEGDTLDQWHGEQGVA
jgi:hypothetical protein